MFGFALLPQSCIYVCLDSQGALTDADYARLAPQLKSLLILIHWWGEKCFHCNKYSIESFQWDALHPEGSVEKLSSFWTSNILIYSQFVCELECKTIIKAITVAEWEGEIRWPVCRGMVSCGPRGQTPQNSTQKRKPSFFISHMNQSPWIF